VGDERPDTVENARDRHAVDGKKPGDLPVAFIKDFAYVVNMSTAKAIGRFPPVAILQIAETVN